MIFNINAAVLRKFLVSMGRRSPKWMQRKTWDGMPSILELEWTITGQSLRYASEHALFVSLVTPYLQFPSPSPISSLSFLSSFSSSVLSPSFSTSIFFLLPHPTLLFSSLNLGKPSLSMNYIIWYQEHSNEPVQLTYSTFVIFRNTCLVSQRPKQPRVPIHHEFSITLYQPSPLETLPPSQVTPLALAVTLTHVPRSMAVAALGRVAPLWDPAEPMRSSALMTGRRIRMMIG